MDTTYDAFISYSRKSDHIVATALEQALKLFAKSVFALRAMRVFRDDASLTATPSLWGAIEAALSQSRFFVLLASPESAESVWVQKELDWWIRNRNSSTLIIVLTDGTIVWKSNERRTRNEALNFEIARLKRWRFGSSSESLEASTQAVLFDQILADTQLEDRASEDQTRPAATPSRAKGQAVRQALPAKLPRIDHHHEIQATYCACDQPFKRIAKRSASNWTACRPNSSCTAIFAASGLAHAARRSRPRPRPRR